MTNDNIKIINSRVQLSKLDPLKFAKTTELAEKIIIPTVRITLIGKYLIEVIAEMNI